jgi:ubiquitin-activating enzyme E1 C
MCESVYYLSGLNLKRETYSQIKKPSLSAGGKNIYLQAPPQLEQATRPNLEKKLSDLVSNGGDITVTATTLPFNLTLRVNYTSS